MPNLTYAKCITQIATPKENLPIVEISKESFPHNFVKTE